MTQMEKAGREAASIQNQARDAIEADRRVVEALGGSVQVGGPISQSSMSSSINGRTTKQVPPLHLAPVTSPLPAFPIATCATWLITATAQL
jgi:hypothetical protein